GHHRAHGLKEVGVGVVAVGAQRARQPGRRAEGVGVVGVAVDRGRAADALGGGAAAAPAVLVVVLGEVGHQLEDVGVGVVAVAAGGDEVGRLAARAPGGGASHAVAVSVEVPGRRAQHRRVGVVAVGA